MIGMRQDIVTPTESGEIKTSPDQEGYLGTFEIVPFLGKMSQVKMGMTKDKWIPAFDNVEPRVLADGKEPIYEYAFADNIVLRLKGEPLSAAALYSNKGHITPNIRQLD